MCVCVCAGMPACVWMYVHTDVLYYMCVYIYAHCRLCVYVSECMCGCIFHKSLGGKSWSSNNSF